MKKTAILFLLLVSALFSCTNFQDIAGSQTAPELDMSELSVPSDGSGYSLLLTCGVEWDITSKPDWVTVGPISTYTDGDQSAWYKSPKWKVHVSVAGNSGDSRSGSVVFTSASGFAELKVSQDSGLPPVVSVKEVKLDKSELTLYEGGNEQLTATVLPEDATDKTITWSSTDESVATIDQIGLLTAKKAGAATIIVATKDGGKTAQCEVTVLETSGSEAVDIGLGVKWASCNVGARSPEEFGDYFAWGETSPKSDYDESTYKWCNGAYNKLTKYCNKSNYWYGSGSMDNKTVLDLSDDAARANWGGSWRMPTLSECKELLNNCTWTWTTQNGVTGRKVTGPNGKSIFLPAAGYRDNAYRNNVGSGGYYGSSSLNTDGPGYTCYVGFNSGYYYWTSSYRYLGFSVRPVSE